MRSIRRLAVTSVAALIAAVPTAASATSTYRSISFKDSVDDVIVYPSGPRASDPSLDIYKMVAYRYAENFQVTVSYKHLTAAAYTHRYVYLEDLYDADTTRSTLIDLGIGANRARPFTTVTIDKYDSATGEESVYNLPCAGAKARPDYTAGRVVFTLPVVCFKNYDQKQARVVTVAGRWSAAGWRTTADPSPDPRLVDAINGEDHWACDRSVPPAGRQPGRGRSGPVPGL